MFSHLNVLTAQAESDLRSRELLRDLARPQSAAPVAARPSLASRLLAAVQRRRAALAH